MEQVRRKPFQGIFNIIRFNWHFYILASGIILLLLPATHLIKERYQIFIYLLCILIAVCILVSLVVSFYVYDFSGLYGLNWIEKNSNERLIVNIHAGFDETSHLLQEKFKKAELIVLDFYNPKKHTEVSIKRARKAYPTFEGTGQIQTADTTLADNTADKIFIVFSAHEIRDETERAIFFKELYRVIKPTGEIYVTEHLRDFSNFLVYNIGFFHFYSKGSWLKTFNSANLIIKQEMKLTPFVSTFILYKNGITT